MVKQEREALQEISEIIDFYHGSFSFQGVYAIREVLHEVGISPDIDVIKEEKPSPLSTKGNSGKPRRVKEEVGSG